MEIVNVRRLGFRVGDPNYVYCGRPSVLGNPFKGKYHKPLVEKYRVWLWGKIKERDPAIMEALAQLNENSILGCWCVPKPCHCEVIEKAWFWLKEQKIL